MRQRKFVARKSNQILINGPELKGKSNISFIWPNTPNNCKESKRQGQSKRAYSVQSMEKKKKKRGKNVLQ